MPGRIAATYPAARGYLPRGLTGFPPAPPPPPPGMGERVPTYGPWPNPLRAIPLWDDWAPTTAQQKRQLRGLLRDDVVKAAFLTKLFSVSALDWQCVPRDPGDARARHVADWNLYNLQGMRGGTRGLVEAVLFPGLIDGYSVCELTWKDEPEPYAPWQGKQCFRELKSKDGVLLEEDAFGNLVALIYMTPGGMVRDTDLEGLVLFKFQPLFGRPMSDFRATYRAYTIKDCVIKLWTIGHEKFGLPFLKGKYPQGDYVLMQAVEQQIKELKARSYLVLPDGTDIDPVQLLQGNTEYYQNALELCDKWIMLGINGAFLQSMTSGSRGADPRGSSAVQKDTSELFVWNLAQVIADVANAQLVPLATAMNFTGAAPPLCSLGGVNDKDLLPSAQLDDQLLANGVPLSRKDAYMRYNRTPPSGPDDVLRPAGPGAPPPTAPGGGGLPFADLPAEGGPAEPFRRSLRGLGSRLGRVARRPVP